VLNELLHEIARLLQRFEVECVQAARGEEGACVPELCIHGAAGMWVNMGGQGSAQPVSSGYKLLGWGDVANGMECQVLGAITHAAQAAARTTEHKERRRAYHSNMPHSSP